MSTSCSYLNVPEKVKGVERERAIQANKVYCQACEDNGIKICSWENLSGWKDYVDGKIDENQLAERAQDEMKSFSDTFSKYIVVSKDEFVPKKEDTNKKERAKSASMIYRQACSDSGMNMCFFNNFGAWSEYVHGQIERDEFEARARLEVGKMLEEGGAEQAKA